MVPTVMVIATIVIELELFVCFSVHFLLFSLVLTDFLGCIGGEQWCWLQPWGWSWRLPGLVVTLPAVGAVYHNSFSTVFLDSFSHLYFSAAYLNCTSPAVLLNYISRLNSGYNHLKVARAMAVTAVLNMKWGSPLVYHSTHPFWHSSSWNGQGWLSHLVQLGAVCQNTPSPHFSSGHLQFFLTHLLLAKTQSFQKQKAIVANRGNWEFSLQHT